METIDKTKISKDFLKKTSIKDNTFIQVAKDNPKDKIDVEIGDSKTLDKFLPQQKIMRWDNEVNCSVRLIHDEKNPTVKTEGDKIVWEGEKVKAEIYQLTEDEGGQEFEITLKEKPASNVVSFTVVDKGVDYFYQPALTEEEIAQGASRPENVVGSYAVYASEQKTNYVGGKEYKTGKIGHIFRPKIIDSAGTEVWGDLHIGNGILSVTIPQKFIDEAVYPVRHAAGLTFGNTNTGNSYMTNCLYVRSFGLSYTGAVGIVTNMVVSSSKSTNNSNVQLGLYDTSSPSNYVANTNSVLINSTKQWWTATFSSSPNISAIEYYLVWNSDVNVNIYYDSGVGGYRYKYVAGLTFPSTITWGTNSNDYRFSIYATYTAGGSAPTVTTQAVSDISTTTATGNGNVTADGGATVTERGVCWSTSTNPTTANSKATASGTTGAYTVSMTGLSASTLYYVKAYAINSVGTSYGLEVTFTTNSAGIPNTNYLGFF